MFLGWGPPLEREGEAFVVVPGLPVPKGGRGDLKVLEALAPAQLLREAGRLDFHTLRHTFLSSAVQRGATLRDVKELVGHHRSLAPVMRDAHLSPEHCATPPLVSMAPSPAPCPPPSYRRFNANLNARGCRPSGSVSEVLVLVRLAGVEPATLGLEVTFLQRPTFRRLPADPRVPHECTGVRPMTSGCAALVTATVTAVSPR